MEDILSVQCEALLVPSCAWLFYDQRYDTIAYVNDGVGGIIANAYPEIRYEIVRIIRGGGNTVGLLTGTGGWRTFPTVGERLCPYHLINFPVKPGYVYLHEEGFEGIHPDYRMSITPSSHRVPGYMSTVRMGIVEESVKELLVFINDTTWTRIAMPKFDEAEVNAYLMSVLDDRFFLACL